MISLISFSAACSALDYHGTSRRLFVGLDSGTISVSVFFPHLYIGPCKMCKELLMLH